MVVRTFVSTRKYLCSLILSQCKDRKEGVIRVVFVGGGSQGTSPSLDLTFPLTGLSENFPARERMIPRHC